MKRKYHTPEQIMQKLRKADQLLLEGKAVAEICQKLGIAEATFHRWRNQFRGTKADAMRRLKDLECENTHLKKLVADLMLGKRVLRETIKGPA